jgi:6,7-dimethyl-8-ribityllumazine synthase
MESTSRAPRMIEGELDGNGVRIGIVVSRFNSLITDRLLAGALDAIGRSGGDLGEVDVARVPGSLELAPAAQAMAGSGKYGAVVCLGAVIRGETSHFDYVAAQTASGIATVGRESGVPVIFGVITCDNLDQAMNRAGGKSGNQGFSAAMAAIEMANLIKKLQA